MGKYRRQDWTKIRLCNCTQKDDEHKAKLDLFQSPSNEEGFLEVDHIFRNTYAQGGNTVGFFDNLLSVAYAREFQDKIQYILDWNPFYCEGFDLE